MKKFACFFSAIVTVFVFCFFDFNTAAADSADTKAATGSENPNLLADYTSAEWSGDMLRLDEPSGSVYFMSKENKEQSATLVIQRNKAETGFYFGIDAGNGANNGGDSGYCTISFYDEGHEQLLSLSTGQIKNLDNYTRFYIGEETNYFPVPEKTKTVEITLNAVQSGKSDRVNVYFRNLSFHLSSEKPLLLSEKKLYLDSRTGLSKVEIGVTSAARYMWIAIIFLVALAFYLIRVWRQKYSTPKVMNGSDRKKDR